MIFQLGKGKGGNGSESDRATAGGEGDPAFIQSGSGFGATPNQSTGSPSAAETVRRWREAAAVARSSASELIDGELSSAAAGHDAEGAQLSVEWPDPRAAITLNRPISTGGISTGQSPSGSLSGQGAPAANAGTLNTNPALSAGGPQFGSPLASKPEPAKSEGGSLVSRTFPFFRSSASQSNAGVANSTLTNAGGMANSNMTNTGPAVAGAGVPVGNALQNPLANPAEATASRSPAWKEPRVGGPADAMNPGRGRPQLPPEEEIRARFGTNIKSALGPGTIIEGKFRFDSPVSIEGTLIGEVTSNSVLIVGAQANVTAKISVGSLIILGRVQGDVECEELLEIKTGGHLEGDVRSKRIAIDDGGWFRGLSTPTGKSEYSDS